MNKLSNMDRSRLSVVGVVLAVVLLLSVNIFSNATFKGAQWDLTEGRLFSLSEGTGKVLTGIDEPITIRLYFSENLGERSPAHGTYFKRVRELIERYAVISGGKIRLQVFNPEPFSESEDRAVSFGLQGVPVNDSGDLGYLGLAATNSTDDTETIPFLSPDRETFLEYDLTKLVHTLANPERVTVGIISSLPVNGGAGPRMGAGQGKWVVAQNINDFFTVQPIPTDSPEIPEEVDVLFIVHPKGFSPQTLYAIDQFVMKGGRALVFVDANSEIEAVMAGGRVPPGRSDFDKFLTAWGIELVSEKVAGDLGTARRVNVRVGKQLQVTDYVAWLGLKPENFDSKDVAASGINSLNISSAGILKPLEGATTKMSPLIQTTPRSMEIDVDKIRTRPDVIGLFRDFKPSGKPLTLAARITGPAKSVFPDGPPKKKDEKADSEGAKSKASHLAEALKPLNVIVVSDADMLHDSLWVEMREFFGNNLAVPFANNGDFVVNALDNLTGSDALIGLRGRSQSARPFDLVQSIRQDAERKYRAKEQELQTNLTETRAKLNKLVAREESQGNVVLSTDEKVAIDEFRTEMVKIRRELRNVQHALRKDIDKLDAWLKFANIAAIPLLVALGALVLAFVNRWRRRGPVIETS